jgi:hypothetical protein
MGKVVNNPMQYYVNTGCPAFELALIYDLPLHRAKRIIRTANRVIKYQQYLESKLDQPCNQVA